MSRPYLILAAKALLSLLLIAIVVSRVDVGAVVQRLLTVDLRFASLVYLVLFTVISLSAWRWYVLADGLLTPGQALRYTWIGSFFGHVLPGGVSGDIAKGVAIALKHPEMRGLSLPASILVDKLVGLAVLVAFFAIVAGVLFVRAEALPDEMRLAVTWLFATSLVGVGGLSTGLWLVASGGLESALSRARVSTSAAGTFARSAADAVRCYVATPSLLVKAAGISLLIHLANALALWATLQAVGVEPPLLLPLVSYPLSAVAMTLPISVSGIGVRDVVMIGCFALFGLGREEAVAQSWLSVLLTLPVLLVGALVQVAELFARKRSAGTSGR